MIIFQARMDTAFKKRHGWAARWVKAIFAKGYTKVQTRLVNAQSKLSRELAKQAVTTKCRDNINAELAVPLKKAVDFRAQEKICDNHNIFRY